MTPPIFSSPPAVRAVVTLILIENSHGMLAAWNDLRQHYLPTLLGALRLANPIVPVRPLSPTPALPNLSLDTRPLAHNRTRRRRFRILSFSTTSTIQPAPRPKAQLQPG